MYYINMKCTLPGYDHDIETIESAESYKDIRNYLRENRLIYPAGYALWISNRATKSWYEKRKRYDALKGSK